MARARRKQPNGATATDSQQYRCPDCGRTFGRPQSLGAHRRQAHGVAGTSKRSQSRASAASRRGGAGTMTRKRGSRTQTASASRDGQGRSAARPGGNSATSSGVDRDALLNALFPNGIPARQSVLRDVNDWLDHAERLARVR